MQEETSLEAAVAASLDEYDARGESFFLDRFGERETRRILVTRGRRYDADAVEASVAVRLFRAAPGTVIDVSRAAGLLDVAGYHIVELEAWSEADELAWRLNAWAELQARNCVVEAGWLRSRRLYNAGQGIWADKERTNALATHGAAVAVRHTGRHYADDLDDQMIIYHYPRTDRPRARDANEVQAVKNVVHLHLPLFVISDTAGGRLREVRLAWVVAEDDGAGAFLMEFAESEPPPVELRDVEHEPFELTTARRRRQTQVDRLVRDPEFKFRLLRRYQGACAITGVGVPEVLDGAHVVPVDKGGTDDERNGLLLTANLHRAFDANLWA